MPELYPHQITGAEWLRVRSRCGLFDEQGLGKTYTAIRGAQLRGCRKLLVVSPSIVLWNWRREIEALAPEWSVQVIDGEGVLVDPFVSAVVISHGLIRRDALHKQLLQQGPWDQLIVDEAHAFKSEKVQRTQRLYQFGDNGRKALTDVCGDVWPMTGTPMPNDASELWTHLRALAPELISGAHGRPMTSAEFMGRFCVTRWNRYREVVVANKNLDELRAMVKSFALRRLKKDHLPDLPPIRFELLTLTPTVLPWELRALDDLIRPSVLAATEKALAESVVATADGEADAGMAFAALGRHVDFSRFRAICGAAKVDPCVDLLTEELRSGQLEKVFVIAHHLEVIRRLAQGLSTFGVLQITGEVGSKERTERIEQFQTDPKYRVMVGQITACGTGATLTAAREGFMVEMSTVPGINSQAVDRLHRIGQKERVRIRCVALANTSDEAITRLLRNKTRMIRELLT